MKGTAATLVTRVLSTWSRLKIDIEHDTTVTDTDWQFQPVGGQWRIRPLLGQQYHLDDYTVIDHPVKIVGAGGHEFYGVGEGVITVLAPDVNGINRRVRFKCTID